MDDTRCDADAGDSAERWRREFYVRIAKLRMIEGIEEIRPEFQQRILPRAVEDESLCEGQVEIILSGPFENSYSGVAEA